MTAVSFQEMEQKLVAQLKADSTVFENLTSNLSGQRNIQELFSLIWDLDENHRFIVPNLIENSGKLEVVANRLRKEGDDYYKNREFSKALNKYNLSIMKAPHPVLSKMSGDSLNAEDFFVCPQVDLAKYGGIDERVSSSLAKGFASRSAIMFELELYEKCLNDINLAFRYGHEVGGSDEIERRRISCLVAMKESTASGKKIKVDKSKRVDRGRLSHMNLGSVSSLSAENLSLKDCITRQGKKPPRILEVNPNMPSLSSSVKIASSATRGRGLFAVRDICPGEVIAVEEAYSIQLHQDLLSKSCSRCLRQCLTPLPCPGCSEVIFCSEACRDSGLSEDHYIECKILPTVTSLKMEEYSMAYKMLKTFSFNHVKSFSSHLQGPDVVNTENLNITDENIGKSTSYEFIQHLCTNKEKHEFEKLLKYCLVSFVFTKLLEQSGRFFVNEEGEPIIPTKTSLLQTGAALLSHIMKSKMNSYRYEIDKVWQGTALFPTVSFINHSCDPSVLYYFNDRRIVLRTLRPIKAGDEMTICYGQPFEEREKEKRFICFQKYYFQCSCEACEGQWPIISDQLHLRDKCIVCMQFPADMFHICSSCAKRDDMNMESFVSEIQTIILVLVRYNELESTLNQNEGTSEEQFKLLLGDLELLEKYFIKPCRIFTNFKCILNKCFEIGM